MGKGEPSLVIYFHGINLHTFMQIGLKNCLDFLFTFSIRRLLRIFKTIKDHHIVATFLHSRLFINCLI